MLKTKVKASQVTNLTDARYFAARGVDWMGFPLDIINGEKTGIENLMKIKEWISGPTLIGEFELSEPNVIQELSGLLNLKFVQLGSFYSVEDVKGLSNLNIVKEIIIDPSTDAAQLKTLLNSFKEHCNYFILDFIKNDLPYNSYKLKAVLPEAELIQIIKEIPIILNIDFEPEDLSIILDQWQPVGISIRGSEEEKVGFKSYDTIDEIFDRLEENQ